MKVKLIIGQMSWPSRGIFHKGPKIYQVTNLHTGEFSPCCKTTEVSDKGSIDLYWARDPDCPKGDEYVLMKVEPHYNNEWLRGDACGLLNIPRDKK